MKKIIMSLLSLCFLTTTLFASTIKKEIDVEAFSGIRLSGSPTVFVKQRAGSPRVVAEGTAECLEQLVVKVENDQLLIYIKSSPRRWFRPRLRLDNVKVYVEAEQLNSLILTGSGDIKMNSDLFSSDEFALKVTGSGDINALKIEANRLNLSVSGSGDIEVQKVIAPSIEARVTGSGDIEIKEGETDRAEYSVTGSGDIGAKGVEAIDVKAQIIGSGDISCWARGRLTGSVTGSGDVGYRGNPQEKNISKKGFRQLD